MLTVAAVLGILWWGLHFFFGSGWWRVALVLIAVPVLLWALARLRESYFRRIAARHGLSFVPGFPSIPKGTPAHGRSPKGFTGYTLTRSDARVTWNLYEQTYGRTSRDKGSSSAHGIWWQYPDRLFPEFEVHGRTLLDPLTEAMGSVLRSVSASVRGSEWSGTSREILFPDDPEFASRFLVVGTAEHAIRNLLSPAVRRALLEQMEKGTVAGNGDVLLWDRSGRLWGKKALEQLLLKGERLRQAFEVSAALE